MANHERGKRHNASRMPTRGCLCDRLQRLPEIYIGETSRTARLRVKEHREHVRKGAGEKSAVAEHVIETNA